MVLLEEPSATLHHPQLTNFTFCSGCSTQLAQTEVIIAHFLKYGKRFFADFLKNLWIKYFCGDVKRNGLTDDPVSGDNNITTSPLYFVRSGYVYPNRSRLDLAGYNGDYWSGRASSSSGAYYLYFDSSGVRPPNSSYRYYGFSVRCVAGWG